MKHYENSAFPISTPEAQGIPSCAIIHFLDQIRERDLDLHSLQVVRNGHLCISTVAAPYTMDSFHRIFSAAKGVVATAILFAVQDGYFKLDDLVVPLLPQQWIPEDLDDRWNRLTIYHLLTMTTGHEQDTLFKMWGSQCWIKTFFEEKPAYEPGTYFCYDMGAQYVMNELVAKNVGMTLGEYIKIKLMDKLDIEFTNNYTEPEGLFYSSTIQFHPDALTKLSQFYLQKGMWKGEQLLREDLAVLAGEHHCPSFLYDPTGISGQTSSWHGYSLHMWRTPGGGFAFRGGQGQIGMILPSENMAIGMMAGCNNNEEIDEILYRTIIGESFNHPIAVEPYAAKKAQYMLENFNLAPHDVSDWSSKAEEVSGVTYAFDSNIVGQKSLRFEFGKDKVLIHSVSETEEKTISCGLRGEWSAEGNDGYILTKTDADHVADLDRIFNYDTHKTLYSGGWKNQNTFQFYLRSESLLCDYRFACEFIEDAVYVTLSYNTVELRHSCKDRTLSRNYLICGKKVNG